MSIGVSRLIKNKKEYFSPLIQGGNQGIYLRKPKYLALFCIRFQVLDEGWVARPSISSS
jgi:hypothetical protein